MIRKSAALAAVIPVLAGGALLLSAGAASAAAESFTAELSGSNLPNGDASLTGAATVSVDSTSGQVCASVKSNVEGAVAMHIHKGGSGVDGPVVVPLDEKSINGARACASAKADVAAAITADPAGYYVNIHTPAAQAGALRGQLAAATPTGVNAGSGGQAGDNPGPDAALVALMVAGTGLVGAAGWRLARR